jgi:uncharacterized damage-inducible protein DinB
MNTMTTSEALIAEVTREAATTRRVLDRVPTDQLSWTPHPKSMSLGTLALHVATIPGALADLLSAPVRPAPQFGTRPEASSREELLSALDASVAKATAQLSAWDDRDFNAEWRMVNGDQTLLALPRIDMLRSVMLNHWYHHRGELVVYLRLLDVPVPFVYGPSADESPFA